MAPSRKIHTLAHGLRVVTSPQPHLHAACVTLAVRCGSRDDPAARPGLTHFLEHMLFRGSRAYPGAAALIAPFERAGGTLSAETWRDHTLFSTVVHPQSLPEVVHALADLALRPTFADIDAERALIEAELEAELDEEDGDTDLGNVSRAAIWRGHPMGRRIVGTRDALARIDVPALRAHHAQMWRAGNAVLSISGRIDAQEALALARAAFAEMAAGGAPNRRVPPAFRASPRLRVQPMPGSQTSVQLTFEAPPDGHPDFTALTLLVAILDDGMGTRLHRALSERSGLVYAFESGLDCYADAGALDLELQVSPQRVQAAVAAACAVLHELAEHGATADELELARRRALLALELGQDSAEDAAQEAAIDVLFDRGSPDRHLRALRRVSLADIQRLARQMFAVAPRHMTILGPTEGISMPALRRAFAPPARLAAAKAPAQRGRRRA